MIAVTSKAKFESKDLSFFAFKKISKSLKIPLNVGHAVGQLASKSQNGRENKPFMSLY